MLKGHGPVIREAAQLLNLRFNSRIRMLPRQHLNLVPCEARGWVVQRERSAHEVAKNAPGIELMQVFIPWGSILDGRKLSAEVR